MNCEKHLFYRPPLRPDRRLAALVLLLAPLAAQAQDELAAARQHLLRGRYAEALESLPADAAEPAAALVRARALEETGKPAEARRERAAALERSPMSATLLAALAEDDYARGDLAAGDKRLAAALERAPNSPYALALDADRLERLGEPDAAARRRLQLWGLFQRERETLSADDLLHIGQAVAAYARRSANADFFPRLVRELYPAVLRKEPNEWRAHAALARLFLEKYNEADAAAALQAGLALNPRAADLHALEAELALSRFDLPRAEAAVRRARARAAQHLAALVCETDLLLADVQPAAALAALEKALASHPRSPALLGRKLACCAHLDGAAPQQPSPRISALLAGEPNRSVHAGAIAFHAGAACARMRHFPLAEAFFREALARDPDFIYTPGELGLMLMRLGDEAGAGPLLQQSFARDPFHVRVKNSLEVLDVLQGYAVLETEHFVLRFDRGRDDLLARCMARELEDHIWPEVTQQLGFSPPEKTLIEIFSRARNTGGHGWFSARMVGLPFIGTVGACAGKMLALVSPREAPSGFDWGRVLRHEFTHIVNLQQTDFRTPHWLTEGIAVRLEETPRPPEWDSLLRRRLAEGKLFTLRDITWGFVRPSSHEDWSLAYCQAELYVEHLVRTAGPESIARLLAAFRDRAALPVAIERASGQSLEAFEQGYLAYLRQVVADAQPPARLSDLPADELTTRLAKQPADPALLAAQAQQALARGDPAQARRLAEAAAEKSLQFPAAVYVLARLEQAAGNETAALRLLQSAHDAGKADADTLLFAGELALAAGELAAAENAFLRGEREFPRGHPWRKSLARVYLQRQDSASLTATLQQLAGADPDQRTIRKKLAQLHLADGRFEEAHTAAREAIRLQVDDALAQALLGQARAGLSQHAAAAEALQAALDLGDEQSSTRLALVRALLANGQHDAARKAADPLRKLHAASEAERAEVARLLKELEVPPPPKAAEKSVP